MANNMLKDALLQILSETERYDFPLFANASKKKAIIEKTKQELDARLAAELQTHGLSKPTGFCSESLWQETLAEVCDKFSDLPANHILNGFYYQELMHTYVSNNVRLIDGTWYDEICAQRRTEA